MRNHAPKLGRALAGALLACLPLAAVAQAYPNKPIRLVVPYAPGAITDIAARLIADRMSPLLGQQVVVDNRGGAGTRIGVQNVATSPADGYSLLFANSITHGTVPAMSKSLPFDPVKDFAPVVPLFWYASTLVCHSSVPYSNVQEFIAYAKKYPGKITSATAGPGSGHHLSGSLFTSMTGVEITHVHYKGGGPGLQDVLAGNVNCIYGDGAAKPHVDAGRLKAFATTGLQPDPRFPGVPTMDAAGVKGYNTVWWQGIVAPAATPPEAIVKLNSAANEALKDPALVKRAMEMGIYILGGSPEKLGQQIREDIAKFAKIVKDANIPQE
jgi:tripartite-type tricarboxylate transporter receptor subunit TctC